MVSITCEPFCNAGDVYLSVLEELDHTEHVLEPRHVVFLSQRWVELINHSDNRDDLQPTDPLWFLEHSALPTANLSSFVLVLP